VIIGTIPGPITVAADSQVHPIPGSPSFTWTTPAGSAHQVEVLATSTPVNPNDVNCSGQPNTGDFRVSVLMTIDGAGINAYQGLWATPGSTFYYGNMTTVGSGTHTATDLSTFGLQCARVLTDIIIKGRLI